MLKNNLKLVKKIVVLLLFSFLLASAYAHTWQHENISNAVFAKQVKDRIPTGIITKGNSSLGKLYFFTNIRNLSGNKITHRWIYKNKILAEVSFEIKDKRWRVWSSKNLWNTWLGPLKVEVVVNDKDILLTKIFILEAKDE